MLFRAVPLSALGLLVLFGLLLGPRVARGWLQGLRSRRDPPLRTWALFVDGKPERRRHRRLADRVRAADPGARVVVYDRRSSEALARRLGVGSSPALVLGDGAGGARLSLEGREALEAWLRRRAEDDA